MVKDLNLQGLIWVLVIAVVVSGSVLGNAPPERSQVTGYGVRR
jgi:hypothetical protein